MSSLRARARLSAVASNPGIPMAPTLFDLSGKTSLVTGAARGLGLAIARALGRAGARLVLNDLDAPALADAISGLRRDGLWVAGRAFDVRDAAAIRREVPPLEREAGSIQILVNNAGIQRRAPLGQLGEPAWHEVLDTCLSAPFLLAQELVPGMIARRAGKIINIASIMGARGRPTIAPYMAAKGGLQMLTKAMALEWGRYNIQVNAIGPGYLATELNRPLLQDQVFDAWVQSRTPAGRWGYPEDIASVAIYLAS
ncbi:MAG TPA: SDR family NAD(P)-dependent oxidoreductase, partial [Candidatus Sulfotelmatobacter sp.]|nr:SDR family NAD(P)-dependent oxidoreductase [Candidatus Sulfotelmatobacter sp.]